MDCLIFVSCSPQEIVLKLFKKLETFEAIVKFLIVYIKKGLVLYILPIDVFDLSISESDKFP